MESGFKCGSGEPDSSFCVMMDILYHVPHLCGGFFAIFNELNSKRYVQILFNQKDTNPNETKEIDVSKYQRGMLFVLFNAGGSTQQSNILYSFSRSSNNKTSLVEMINKNQQASGYKIDSVALNQDTLEITTGIYGGSMIVIYFGV